MKVILTEDVEKLGNSSEVVDVADGYARNYLVPRSLAVPATKSAMANLNNLRRIGEARQVRLKGAADGLAARLAGVTLILPAKTGSGGKLYGSISAADIAAQLKKDHGVDLDKKQISLPEPIRTSGLHAVPLTLHRDVKPQLTVQVGEPPAGGFAPLPTAAAEPAAAAA